jgi:DNA-binding protein H-NS
MAKTLAQLNAEISKLEAEASALRNKERSEVIGRIKEAIAAYELTASDLGLARDRSRESIESAPKKTRRGKGTAGKKSAGVEKYRDGQGNSWTGHGRRPQWFLKALANGKSEADLLA